MLGATCSNSYGGRFTEATAWFGHYGRHSIPAMANFMSNAILKTDSHGGANTSKHRQKEKGKEKEKERDREREIERER